MSDLIEYCKSPVYLRDSQNPGDHIEDMLAKLKEAGIALEARDKTIAELVDLLEGAGSGFISCSGSDEDWKRRRDALISKAQSKDKAE